MSKTIQTKKTKTKVPLDPQLELFNKRNLINKKHNKTYFEMAPNTKGIQKATGIHHANSDTWELDSKDNIYSILPENKLKWNKKLPKKITKKNILKIINFEKTNKEKIINDQFPKINNQTNLEIIINNDIEYKFLIKTMSFCKFNKGVTPAGTEGRQNKNGEPMKQWLKLAIFEMIYIKLTNNYYLCIKQKYGNNGERLVAQSIINKENKDKIKFHVGLGYCKLEDDNKNMYGLICLSPDYKDETCMELIKLNNNDNNINDNIKISVVKDNTNVILYENKYINNDIEIIKNINIINDISNNNQFNDVLSTPTSQEPSINNDIFNNIEFNPDNMSYMGPVLDNNMLFDDINGINDDYYKYSSTNSLTIDDDIDLMSLSNNYIDNNNNLTFKQQIEENILNIKHAIKNNQNISLEDQNNAILGLKYVTDLLNGFVSNNSTYEPQQRIPSEILPELPTLPLMTPIIGEKRPNIFESLQLPPIKKLKKY